MDSKELQEFLDNWQKFKEKLRKHNLTIVIVSTISFIIIGLWLTYRIYSNYYLEKSGDIYFSNDSNIQDLGNVLSGTVGVWFTLVGILLLAYTLYQTQTEIKTTQSILTTQLVESTFFNLLKNHKDVILGSRMQTFDSTIEKVLININKYIANIRVTNFPLINETEYHPNLIYKKSQLLKDIGKSLIHIANLLETVNENNREFYHTTFYYNLSFSEKQLIGLIIYNKSEPTAKEYKFNYTEAYLNAVKYNQGDRNYFPPVIIQNFPSKKEILVPSLSVNDIIKEEFQSQCLFTLQSDDLDLKIKSVDYIYCSTSTPLPNAKLLSIIPPNNIINYSHLFKELDFQALLMQIGQPFMMKMVFTIEYKNVPFSISSQTIRIWTFNVARSILQNDTEIKTPFIVKFQYHHFPELITFND